MKAFEALAAQLAHLGVTDVFGLMGDGNLKLIPTLVHEHGITVHAVRHEAAAVAMADGYARSSGRVGVCTVTQGPGLTNALTALITAHRGRTPLVALVGDTPVGVQGLPQDIDEAPLVAAAGLATSPFDPATAHADLARAWRTALDTRRPVVMILPTDLQEMAAHDTVCELPVAARVPVSPGDLSVATEALASAARPVIVAGRGALEGDCRDDVVALADHVGALLATTLPLNGWFSGHPFAVGIAGGFAPTEMRELLGEADCVLALGASLNHFTTRGGGLFSADATIVQVDEDPGAHGRYTRHDVAVVGDAGAVARDLLARVPGGQRFRTAEVADRIASGSPPEPDAGDGRGLDPRLVARTLARALPDSTVLAVDGGHFMGFPSMAMPVTRPANYVFTLDFGSIGLGLAAAIGASVADPSRTVVAAVGDGGLLMSLGELDTVARSGLPVVVAVFNDAAYGAELHFLRMSGLPSGTSQFPTTAPLAPVAEALGLRAMTVDDEDTLEACRQALEAGVTGPTLIDFRITDGVRAAWLEEAFNRGTH
ncbi:thiamine pyrophosphate-binding protein [Nocardioides hwasunensis]|uniref:Thiamine pyrophosphate-binding protein n=1 Tax=Nocardioides hwasunensis TaxID=397258 RepID=A0ABR8MLD5_9ACTN|nr:thiamine pyrophosphate-binding protein [Nocardioides hwasunensis]MBD3916758.1 thiamine pyrophosphate-binding protein [Nocardioides hwasunensis]